MFEFLVEFLDFIFSFATTPAVSFLRTQSMLHKILGVELLLHNLKNQALYPALGPPRAYKDKSYRESEAMVMIVPEGSIMLSVVRQGQTIYVQNRSTGELQWHVSTFLPANAFKRDTVVHALLYCDIKKNHVLGLFDMTRMEEGEIIDDGILQRHMMMRSAIKEHTVRELQIKFLWVGYEKDCVHALLNPSTINGLNFKVKCIAKLPTNVSEDEFIRIIPPLRLPGS